MHITDIYDKAVKVINSCATLDQLNYARNYIILFFDACENNLKDYEMINSIIDIHHDKYTELKNNPKGIDMKYPIKMRSRTTNAIVEFTSEKTGKVLHGGSNAHMQKMVGSQVGGLKSCTDNTVWEKMEPEVPHNYPMTVAVETSKGSATVVLLGPTTIIPVDTGTSLDGQIMEGDEPFLEQPEVTVVEDTTKYPITKMLRETGTVMEFTSLYTGRVLDAGSLSKDHVADHEDDISIVKIPHTSSEWVDYMYQDEEVEEYDPFKELEKALMDLYTDLNEETEEDEEDHEELWKLDWNDPTQLKYYVYFNHRMGRYDLESTSQKEIPGVDYISWEQASSLLESLNS